jgi:hypothetical protein
LQLEAAQAPEGCEAALATVLSAECVRFLADLAAESREDFASVRAFWLWLHCPCVCFLTNTRKEQLYRKRVLLQAQVQNDTPLDFRTDTAHIRGAEWQVDPLPQSVLDRRVDIGDVPPGDANRLFEALYSGASVRQICS